MIYEAAESSHQKPQRVQRNAFPPVPQSWLTACTRKLVPFHDLISVKLTKPALMSVAAPIGKQPMNKLCAGCEIIRDQT